MELKTRFDFNTDSHYFVPLRPTHSIFGICFTSSDDELHYIECKLEPYTFDNFNYKLYAIPVHDMGGMWTRETYYTSDFKSLVRSGIIVEKTDENMHVEKIRGWEFISGEAYLVHNGEIIV